MHSVTNPSGCRLLQAQYPVCNVSAVATPVKPGLDVLATVSLKQRGRLPVLSDQSGQVDLLRHHCYQSLQMMVHLLFSATADYYQHCLYYRQNALTITWIDFL